MEAIISISQENGSQVSCTEVKPLSNEFGSVRENLIKNSDWYTEVQTKTGANDFYGADNFIGSLKERLINGQYSSDDKVLIHSRDENSNWSSTPLTLRELAKENFDLSILFTPVKEYALTGLRWGVMAGAGIKLIDTFIGLLMADPATGFFFAVAVAVVFIPRIGVVGSIAAGFILTYLSGVNVFLIGIVSALTGAILGALPGMGIGGVMGLLKKSSIVRAHDAEEEPQSYSFSMAILPLTLGVALIMFYFLVINPWLLTLLN